MRRVMWSMSMSVLLLVSCGDDDAKMDMQVLPDRASPVDRRESLLSSPWKLGFGQNTTGAGLDGALYTVTNTNDGGPGSLREGLETPNSWVIYDPSLDGRTIRIDGPLRPAANVTWDGRDALVLIAPNRIPSSSEPLISAREGNLIMHRILWGPEEDLSESGSNRVEGLELRGENYWIDHCESRFTDGDSMIIGGGALAAKNVTVTHYKVQSARRGMIISQNEAAAQDAGNACCVTIAYADLSAICRVFDHQGGNYTHGFNNYVHDFGGDSCGNVARHGDAPFHDGTQTPVMLIESTVYNDGNVALRAESRGDPSIDGLPVQAYAYTNGLNLFLRGSSKGDFVFDPGDDDMGPGRPMPPYIYELIPTDEVEGYVVANAGVDGANLQFP